MRQTIRLTENDLRNMIHQVVKQYINEEIGQNNLKIKKLVNSMRSHTLDLSEDGYGVLDVDYDPQTNELYAGYSTNAGTPKNFTIQYDDDFSLDENLQALVEEIFNNPPTE